jgi:hypothetical protein
MVGERLLQAKALKQLGTPFAGMAARMASRDLVSGDKPSHQTQGRL